jgi:AcrR family transcriptional regulator
MESFLEQLVAAAAEAGLRKGERTRRRIRWAAARALMEAPYAELSVDGICAGIAVTRTAFYVYYPSKADLVREVLTDFQHSVLVIRGARATDPRAGIVAANRAFWEFVRLNAPLMERIRELRDELPELIAERQRVNALWAARIARSVRRHSRTTVPEAALIVRIHAVIFMVEDFAREVFVIRNPNLAAFGDDCDLLVSELSEVWYRALYAPAAPRRT